MTYYFPSALWPIEGNDRSANSHLNALKERDDAINFGWWMINRIWGEDQTAALAYAPQASDSLKIVATTVPSMQVKVLLGAGFLAGIPFRKSYDSTTAAITAPSSDPRIDTIGIDPTDGSVVIYTGTEASSPVAPSVASGIFKAGEIYLRVGSTAIYDAEQSTGGYIQNLRTVLSLPGSEPHTSGLTVSGGAFVHDGSSGDITMPADGLSIESNYAGEFNIDATNAAGFLVFRTGGSTDKLTLGTPANPIILHGSSHDVSLSADGETLQSDGPNRFILEQVNGTGIGLKTDSTLRATLDENGELVFIGSAANIALDAAGNVVECDYDGGVGIKATHANGSFNFYVGGEAQPIMRLVPGVSGYVDFMVSQGANNTVIPGSGDILRNSGDDQWKINQVGAEDGIVIQTNTVDRYQVNEVGRHDFWGDVYFNDDVYILGTLYIDGVPITGDDLPGGSAYGTITLPGTVFEPASSGGSGGADSEEISGNVLLFQSYPDAADGYACAPNVLMPLNYNDAVAVHVRVRWSANTSNSNNARFTLQTGPQGEGDAAGITLNTAAAIVDANAGTANQMRVSEWTALDVTGIAAGDAFLLRLDRTPTHSLDTLGADVRVHSVDIRYSRGAT